MASLRKRYQDRVESPDKSGPAPAATPIVAAELPPPADDKVPTEPIQVDEPSPVQKAEQSALKARLAEVERAEGIVRQQQQTPQKATEPSPPPEAPTLAEAIANLPERIKRWYIAHPEFLTNPEKAAQVQYCHWVARRETGEEFTEPYFDRMEALLGVEREMRSYGNGAQPDTIPTEPQQRDTAPRTSAPPVRRQASAGLVSAPPTRDVLSMTSGRPASEPLRLTREEQELARTLGLTDSQYIEGKKRMMAEKAAGLHGR